MQNDPNTLERKTSKQEIIFEKESYFADVVTFLIFTVAAAVGYIYSSELGVFLGLSTGVVILIIAVFWIFTIIPIIPTNPEIITVSDDGIAAKRSEGGWSYKWSEINYWNALADSDGDRLIRFTTTDYKPKTHTLKMEVIDRHHYLRIRNIFITHCGKPTKVDSWLLANAPADE